MPKFTVVELSETEAKVFQASRARKGVIVVEGAHVVDFSDLDREETGMIERAVRLRECFRKNRISQGEGGVLIQKQNSIARTAILPSGNPSELEEMARFEAEKFIPFNAERHIISHGILHLDEVNGSHVLLTAVDSPVMDQSLAMIKDSPIDPLVAEVTSVALARAFAYFLPENEKPPSKEEGEGSGSQEPHATILMNIGLGQTDMNILDGKMLMTSRSLGAGMTKLLRDLQKAMHLEREITVADLAELDLNNPDDFLLDGGTTRESDENISQTKVGDKVRQWLGQLVRFLRQTYEYASREHEIPTKTRIYLCGDATRIPGLAETLGPMVGVEVHIFNPLEKLERNPKATINEDSLAGMVNCLGCAIRLFEEEEDSSAAIDRANLLPTEVIEARAANERKILLVLSAVMVLITGAVIYLAWDERLAHAAELEVSYRNHNRAMAPLVEQIEQKRTQLEIIESIRTGRAPALYILDQITTFPGIGSTLDGGRLVLTEFRYTPRDEVILAGDALSVEDIGAFSRFLEDLDYNGAAVFDNVGIPANQSRELSRGRGNVWTFSMTASLQTSGEEPRRTTRR
ncbi:MAG: pilus assembly protein PilM [Candidatus Sumerlaeia bacterium]|nr:pilus assembly protein PilM [Candidatus Sumerlaeia bacterium]